MINALTFSSRRASRLVRGFVTLAAVAIATTSGAATDPLQRRSGHPYLTYSDANIARLKERVRNERGIADAWAELLARANRAFDANTDAGPSSNELLCLAYRMTGEKKYDERVQRNLLAQNLGGRDDAILLQRNPPWHSSLGSGAACAAFGVEFDSVYDLLSGDERRTLAQRLAEKG